MSCGTASPSDWLDRETRSGNSWQNACSDLPDAFDVLSVEDAQRDDEALVADIAAPDSADGATVLPLDQSRRRSRLVIRSITVVATAAAVLAVVLGFQVAHLNNQVGQLRAAASKPALSGAVETALEDPSTKRVMLNPPGSTSSGSSSVEVVLTSSGTGYVIPQKLSALPGNKTYQLWGVIKGQRISLGLLGSKPSVTAFSVDPYVPVSTFAITAEQAGGVVSTTNSPVVQGQVSAA